MNGFRNNIEFYQCLLSQTSKILGKDQDTIHFLEENIDSSRLRSKRKSFCRELSQEMGLKLLIAEANVLYSAKDYQKAISTFTKALAQKNNDSTILISRANCYIKLNQIEDALIDIDTVLEKFPNNFLALLTKAEAYYSIDEYEYALIYFNKGANSEEDKDNKYLSAFKDGVTRCKSAILSAIKGGTTFQANPNYSLRKSPVKHLNNSLKSSHHSIASPFVSSSPNDNLSSFQQSTQEKHKVLGELQKDYDYLLELQEEVSSTTDHDENKKEDEKIEGFINDTFTFLERSGVLLASSGNTAAVTSNTTAANSPNKRSTAKIAFELPQMMNLDESYIMDDKKMNLSRPPTPKDEEFD